MECSAGNAGGANVQVNHPTVGIVSNGGIVEVEIQSKVLHGTSIDLLLRSPDSATAVKMANAINNLFPATSLAKDSGLVNVEVPVQYRGQITNFIAAVGNIDVKPDVPRAGVIINERTGTIVATQNVRISPVAVSNSNITIFLNPTTGVSQPLRFLRVQLQFWRVRMPN